MLLSFSAEDDQDAAPVARVSALGRPAGLMVISDRGSASAPARDRCALARWFPAIAQMMRLGWYRAVHVKNIDMQRMRTLLTNRKLLKRKLIDLENHVRSAGLPNSMSEGALLSAGIAGDRTSATLAALDLGFFPGQMPRAR
ncbi:hypothetical protein [Bradyrhizobium roseum]|uniref:hypothetical protein n=1 Tax=Bradyrhizobium roseum TaxID=3056648 RepID=UPI00260D03A8|nr:hypothetical protein [Bradyrhizobium roseus]WKA30399.1 hypothetical protein QUH67_09620 [Bradyrhizobium roseus]